MKVLEKRLGETGEKILLIAIIGSLDAIKNRGVTIDEAEKFLFSPHMVKKLKSKKCDKKIIELVEAGCELEDIDLLIPGELNEAIDEMKQEALKLLKNYKELNESFWLEDTI